LLEAVVYSHRAALELPIALARASALKPEDATNGRGADKAASIASAAEAEAQDSELTARREEVRRLMWERAGIVRSMAGLSEAESRLRALQLERERASADNYDSEHLELRNVIEASRLIVRSALLRRESRGLHYLVDHPHRDNERFLKDTILVSNPTQETY
jgi:L-aspartate oxidase